jgi:6,7-dimethyl-8-ribityllumazine synthase
MRRTSRILIRKDDEAARAPRPARNTRAPERLTPPHVGAACYRGVRSHSAPRPVAGPLWIFATPSMVVPHVPSEPNGSGLRIAVVVSRWYEDVTGRLREAALATLRGHGVAEDDVLLVDVPGAFELPQAALWIARAGLADAVVALGCVVRGETPHFEYVAGTCADGLMRAAQETGIPVTFGVITADTLDQAAARSGAATGKGGNKGSEAADAAVRLAATYRALEARRRP